MKFQQFLNRLDNDLNAAIQYLIDKQILFVPICIHCNNNARVCPTNYAVYRCNNSTGGINCNFKSSLFKNTIFYDCKIQLKNVFYIIDSWRKGVVGEIVAEDCEISIQTVCYWYRKLDEIVIWDFEIPGPKIIGGRGVIVEVDECLAVKRKSHRGRILRNQVWIFGGVERGNSRNYFIEVVESRNRPTLASVLRRRVKSHSIIMTDLWKGYLNISVYLFEFGYLHYTVNHSLNFVDPESGAYTQSIEGFWSVYKRMVRKRGTNIGNVARRINLYHVYRFLKDNRADMFDRIIELVKNYTIFGIDN